VGEQQENELSSPLSYSLSTPCLDVNPTTIDALPPKEVDNSEGDEPIDDSMPPKGTPTPSSCASTTPPPFPNRLKDKKAQYHVNKIRETFLPSQDQHHSLDVIQQMPPMLVFSRIFAPLREPLMYPRGHLMNNVM